MKIDADLGDPVNRIDGVACVVFHDLATTDMPTPACAYPRGALEVYSSAYQIDRHHLAWSPPEDGGASLDLHVHWESVWVANVDEVYGCIENAVATAAATDWARAGGLTVEVTFGTPVFAAVAAPGDGDWLAWGASLPVAFRITGVDGGEVWHRWLLDANGQSYPQSPTV